LNGSVVGAWCKYKTGAVWRCKHVATLLLYFRLEYELSEIPKLAQYWSIARHINDALFLEISFVHNTYDKCKPEEE